MSVQISAPAREGEANEELVSFIADVLGIRKGRVSLDKGAKSRIKQVIVEGLKEQEILSKLKAACNP